MKSPSGPPRSWRISERVASSAESDNSSPPPRREIIFVLALNLSSLKKKQKEGKKQQQPRYKNHPATKEVGRLSARREVNSSGPRLPVKLDPFHHWTRSEIH